jgi:threonine dehydrogenase-like Zn-dependent dehydrogenase
VKVRTIRYTPDGEVELATVEVGDPGPGQVQVEAAACGICSWDITTCKLGRKFRVPAPAGHEGIGYVSKLGPGVEGLSVGDRVAAGGFAKLANVPAARAYKIPDSSLGDEHWIVEPVSCAVTGIDHCRLKPADRVCVIGCGFMGMLILQGLLRSYADELVGIELRADRLEVARRLGVTELYNDSEVPPADLAARLKPRGFDVVVDTTGTQEGLDLATSIVRTSGTINLFGWIKGERAGFDTAGWHLGGFTLVNSAPASQIRDPFPPAIRMMARGFVDLRPLVTHVVTLDEYPALMRSLVKGEPSYIKGVVRL